MRFIAILSVGLALSLSGCGSSEDDSRPPFPNAMAPVKTTASSASDSGDESDSSGSDDSEGQYEGTSVEGMSVDPTVNPSDGSETPVNSEASASANDQSAEQASDASDGQ